MKSIAGYDLEYLRIAMPCVAKDHASSPAISPSKTSSSSFRRAWRRSETFTRVKNTAILTPMNTPETDIEIDADGSMRLLSPLPEWLKPGRAHVVLTVADAAESNPKRQIPTATPEMIA